MAEINQELAVEDEKMSLVDHLQELRQRLIRTIIAVLLTSSLSYYFVDHLMGIMTRNVGKLYYLSPAEAFFTYCKLALAAGFILALPIVMYEMWAFIIPAFTTHEKVMALILVPSSVILFYIGLSFSYLFVLPLAVKFFLGFSSEVLQPLFSLGQYVSFVLAMLIPFGVVFQLPLVIVVLAKFGIINSKALSHYRKYVIILSFIVGGIVSPTPDIFGQILLALPILILYEISFVIVKFILKR